MHTGLTKDKILRRATPLLCLLTVWLLSACRDEPEDPDGGIAMYQNIATYVGDNNSGRSMLEYREINDSPIVTLTLQGRLNQEQVPIGTRLLVTYTLPEWTAYGTSTGIEARSLNVIYNGTVKTDATALPSMEESEGIYVMTFYRSGEYLNLMAQLPASSGKREFDLVADATTLNDEIPQLYLTTHAENEEGYNRKTIASLNMGAVWNMPSCKGVEVHLKNTNNIYQQRVVFLKSE